MGEYRGEEGRGESINSVQYSANVSGKRPLYMVSLSDVHFEVTVDLIGYHLSSDK